MINKIVNYSACLIGLFPAVLTAQIKPDGNVRMSFWC